MLTKTTVNRLHPEVLRRFHALIHAAATAGVPLGVGTGWRVQPNPPPAGFAKPGNSWHESCPVSPSSPTALAIDTVPNISWDWMHDPLRRLRAAVASATSTTNRGTSNPPRSPRPAGSPPRCRRSSSGNSPAMNQPPPAPVHRIEEDDDMRALLMAKGRPEVFILSGNAITWAWDDLTLSALYDIGAITGMDDARTVDQATIQHYIDHAWTGGKVPTGYRQP